MESKAQANGQRNAGKGLHLHHNFLSYHISGRTSKEASSTWLASILVFFSCTLLMRHHSTLNEAFIFFISCSSIQIPHFGLLTCFALWLNLLFNTYFTASRPDFFECCAWRERT